ncbi:MAG: GNAT family N-acetyltransferase [Devosia sp.]
MTLPTPLEIERAGLKAWPGIDVEWDGSWVRRASLGYTQRANSAQCFDPADDSNVEQRISQTRDWFEARGLPPIFRINLLTGPNLRAALDDQRWTEVSHSHLYAMELEAHESDLHGEVRGVHDEEFLAVQRTLKRLDDETMDKLKALLGALEVPAVGLIQRDSDGNPVASALMAIGDNVVITGNVVTDITQRGKGYATAMMRTGLAWAHHAGARFAALNVEAENTPALALYGKLGYRHQYDYVYRYPPQMAV